MDAQADSGQNYNWQQVLEPGRYERNVDEAELFYTTLARLFENTGRIFFAITGYVKISLVLSDEESTSEAEARLETALRKAWRRLRYDHPTIASKVVYDSHLSKCKKIYESPACTAPTIDERQWLEQYFQSIDTGVSGLEFCNADPPVLSYPVLFCIRPPQSEATSQPKIIERDLVLRSHHDIIDGIGTLMLLNNLLTHASEAYSLQDKYTELAFGDEHKNLSPPFRLAANIPRNPTPAQAARLQSILANNDAVTKHANLLSAPFKNKTSPPARNQRVAITLSELETASILQRCKTLHASVTHAFHAAIVLAVRDLQERGPQLTPARYINYCLINLRDRCTPPFNGPRHPATVYHSASGSSLVVDLMIPAKSESESESESPEQLQAEFARILHEVSAFYRAVQDDPDHVGMVPLYYTSITPPYPAPDQACEVPSPNQTPSVSISSMGVLDKIVQPQHGALTAHDPWVTGEELGTGIGVFLGTWLGRLSVSAGYNEAYHDREEVLGFLERVTGVLEKALA